MIAIGLRRRYEADIKPDDSLIVPQLFVDMLIDVVSQHGGIYGVSVDGDVVRVNVGFV